MNVESKTNNEHIAYFLPSEHIAKSIDLQRIEGAYGREMVGYRLFRDGVVRRWDGGDMFGKKQRERELGVEPSMRTIRPEEKLSLDGMAKAIQKSIENSLNVTVPNARLERQMGYNEQPISSQELEGLIDLLSSPDVTVRK